MVAAHTSWYYLVAVLQAAVKSLNPGISAIATLKQLKWQLCCIIWRLMSAQIHVYGCHRVTMRSLSRLHLNPCSGYVTIAIVCKLFADGVGVSSTPLHQHTKTLPQLTSNWVHTFLPPLQPQQGHNARNLRFPAIHIHSNHIFQISNAFMCKNGLYSCNKCRSGICMQLASIHHVLLSLVITLYDVAPCWSMYEQHLYCTTTASSYPRYYTPHFLGPNHCPSFSRMSCILPGTLSTKEPMASSVTPSQASSMAPQ